MKKLIIISALFLIPIVAFGASCYEQWLSAYDNALDQYKKDLAYCQNRGFDSMSFRCADFAKYDLEQSINKAADTYYRCLNIQ